MNKTLRAFHGDTETKTRYVARMKAHIASDELTKGATQCATRNVFRGCAVACTLNKYNHAAAEIEIGYPEILMRLEDGIFESLPFEAGRDFALEFLECVPVGADLTLVASRFLHWLLIDAEQGVIRFADEADGVAIRAVAELYERRINGDEPTENEWKGAAEAAAEASAYAADAADAAAAEAAAYAAYAAEAAEAAAEAAAYAAYAARAVAYAADAAYVAAYAAGEAAYAARAARAATRFAQTEKLIELMRNAPVGAGE